MLKTLLKEVARGLRAKNAAIPETPSDSSSAESRRAAFRAAETAQRHHLAQTLATQLLDNPKDLDGWCLLGDWQLELGNLDAAEQAYRQGLQLQPLHGRSQEGLGLVLLQVRRFDEAYLHFETAHKLDPNNAEILTHWGLVDMELGNIGKAADKFQRAIERNPQNPHAWHNLGLTAIQQGQTGSAIQHLQRAVAVQPTHALAYGNLALVLGRAERYDEAITAARQAIALRPALARPKVILADLLMARGNLVQASETLDQALRLDPNFASTHVARGKLHTHTGQYDLARTAYQTALALTPHQADATLGLAEVSLLTGQWHQGWQQHEARLALSPPPVRRLPLPDWEGPRSSPQTVLVQAEQGIGDIILFASCLSDMERAGVRCVVEVRPRLHGLFKRSFPSAHIVSGEEDAGLVTSWLADLPRLDAHVPIGSLPKWFRQHDQDFPRHAGYLRPDPEAVAGWRKALKARSPSGTDRFIGLTWKGGTAGTSKHQRSLQLQDLARAVRGTGRQLVCLQYGDTDQEIADLARNHGIQLDPGLSGYADLDDVAALTCACDSVVTVCSTQAHLCGALGQPALVLVPFNPSWRYGARGTSTPWYPNLQLARQASYGDWQPPLAMASTWLDTVMAAPASHRCTLP